MWRLPLPQQEVVRLDVSVDDADGVQLLHRGQDADGQVHDKRLRHQLLTQGFVDVHCILGAESDVRTFLHTARVEIRKLPVINMAISADTNQQGAVIVELCEQNAAVVEQVSGSNGAEEVTRAGLQPSVQLGVDVKLPGIGRFLDLQGTKTLTVGLCCGWLCAATPPPHTFNTIFSEVTGSVARYTVAKAPSPRTQSTLRDAFPVTEKMIKLKNNRGDFPGAPSYPW